MTSWKTMTWRGRLKLLAFSLVPVILLLVLAQLLAYWSIDRSITIKTDSVTGQSSYSMRIGHWPWAHRSYTPLNTLGLPDIEFAGLVPKGKCIHVLWAGDSYTFGDATDHDKRWGDLVAGITARKRPAECIRFFNIGVRNTTIDTTMVRIKQVLPLIDPDIVILSQYQNDLTDLANPGSPAWVPAANGKPDSHWGMRIGRLVPGYNVSLLRVLTYQSFAYMIRHNIKYDVLHTWSVLVGDSKQEWANKLKGIYHDLYRDLIADLRARHIQVAVMMFPSKMDVLAQRAPEIEFWEQLAVEYNVPHFNLMPTLDANRAGMPFYMYDGHMNEFGNRVVARAVWEWLFTSEPAPVPLLRRGATSAQGSSSSRSR